jgi:hypothetical protein
MAKPNSISQKKKTFRKELLLLLLLELQGWAHKISTPHRYRIYIS